MILTIVFLLMIIITLTVLYRLLNYVSPKTTTTTATDVITDMLKDPLVTSRVNFTGPPNGPIGDFVGYSPVSQDDWLHSFPHKETQYKGSEYDDIRGLI